MPVKGLTDTVAADVDSLRAEVEQLRAHNERLLDRQNRMMELIGCHKPEDLIHDLRNILNERALLRALTEGLGDA